MPLRFFSHYDVGVLDYIKFKIFPNIDLDELLILLKFYSNNK
jgi:hypothetical protein